MRFLLLLTLLCAATVAQAEIRVSEMRVPGSQAEISMGFVPVVEAAAPAVVNIYARRIVDVRSPQEYQGGHVAGSINIPVGEISSQISRLQKANKPIITCCASGMRSASAATILKNAGLEAVNGGPWTTVNKAQAEAAK